MSKKSLYETYKQVWVDLKTTHAEYLTVEVSDDFVLKSEGYRESVLVPDWIDGTTVLYGIVVTYSTGDTFGHSSGHKTVPIAFVDAEKANELAKQTYDEKWDQDKYGYPSWVGYFNRLESVEVKRLDLTQTALYNSRH